MKKNIVMRGGLIAVFLLSSMSSLFADTKRAQVYILSGQSNMDGVGAQADLPPAYQGVQENVHYWDWRKQEFIPFVAGETRTSNSRYNFGPETGFAAAFHRFYPDTPLYLIKRYASGRGLDARWDNQRWNPGEPAPGRSTYYPGTSAEDPNRGIPYQELITAAQEALHALDEAKIDYEVAGVLWVQGEQDSKNEQAARAYAKNLSHFKDRLYADLKIKNAPFLYLQVIPFPRPFPTKSTLFPHSNIVREQMALADADSGDAAAIPNAYMIRTHGLPVNDDLTHFNAVGQLLLGEKFFATGLEAKTRRDWLENMESYLKKADAAYEERSRRRAERLRQQREQREQSKGS